MRLAIPNALRRLTLTRSIRRARARLRALRRDRRGLAALEFSLIAPMMVVMLFGSVDLVDALGVAQRAQNTAASIADLVSRDTEITDDEMENIWDAADVLMFPSDVDNLQMRVSSVMIETSTTATVVWSDGYHGYSPRAPGSPVSLPANMMVPNTSLILAETKFTYTAPLGMLFGASTTMEHRAQRRARIIDPVERED